MNAFVQVFGRAAEKKPRNSTELKRAEARILAALNSENGRHKTPEEITVHMHHNHSKQCAESTALLILKRMSVWEFVSISSSSPELWMITLQGQQFFKIAQEHRKDLLRLTTSPLVPCFA